MIDPNQFKISCSQIGKIMGEQRGLSKEEKLSRLTIEIDERRAKEHKTKSAADKYHILTVKKIEQRAALENAPTDWGELLSATAQTYCKKWLLDKVYDRRIQATGKAMEKGNKAEGDSIALVAATIDEMQFVTKYEGEPFQNAFMKGAPDMIGDEMIVDTKTSYTHETFPLLEDDAETDYWWQGQGYMHLVGLDKFAVVHCLVNTPEEMIHREARFRLGYDYTYEQFTVFAEDYKFDFIPINLRTKIFRFDYDPEAIEKIETKVVLCRKYIQQLIEKLPA